MTLWEDQVQGHLPPRSVESDALSALTSEGSHRRTCMRPSLNPLTPITFLLSLCLPSPRSLCRRGNGGPARSAVHPSVYEQLRTEQAAQSQARCWALGEQRRIPGLSGSEGGQDKARGKPTGRITSADGTCPIVKACVCQAWCRAVYTLFL